MSVIRPASYPKVSNLLLVQTNTEYSFKLDSKTVRFIVRARDSVSVKLSFQAGESGTNYIEIRSGEYWSDDEVYGDITLYFQTETPNNTIEIIQWIR